MTPCRNCNDGLVVADGQTVLDWYLDGLDYVLCSCCDGDFEDCPNCTKEFPNSVIAVQMGND